MEEKILILGASGFVGHTVAKHLAKKYEVTGTYLRHQQISKKITWESTDILIPGFLTKLVQKFQPTVIINTIAIGNVEECEKNKELCAQINIEPTKEIVKYCEKNPKVKYIFFSSDHVFDGRTKIPYEETNKLNPINYYGQTKLQSEKIITSNQVNYAIIRPCFIFGLPQSHQHQNLFTTIFETLKKKSTFNAYSDKVRSPCYVKDLPLVIEEIIRKHKKGIFHAGSMPVTIHEFAQNIADYFHFQKKLVVGIKSDANEFPHRPLNCSLNTSRTKELGIRFRTLQQAFADIESEMKKNEVSS